MASKKCSILLFAILAISVASVLGFCPLTGNALRGRALYATDGTTCSVYPNLIAFLRAKRQGTARLRLATSAFCAGKCVDTCSTEAAEVCGVSNGVQVTFLNACRMNYESCTTGNYYTLLRQGAC